MNRATELCPPSVFQFYENLESLYSTQHYELNQIWNCDETGVQANKVGKGVVLAIRGRRNVHPLVPNERQWLSVLVAVNFAGGTMPNYYVFKDKRAKEEFISKCEIGACMGMQDN